MIAVRSLPWLVLAFVASCAPAATPSAVAPRATSVSSANVGAPAPKGVTIVTIRSPAELGSLATRLEAPIDFEHFYVAYPGRALPSNPEEIVVVTEPSQPGVLPKQFGTGFYVEGSKATIWRISAWPMDCPRGLRDPLVVPNREVSVADVLREATRVVLYVIPREVTQVEWRPMAPANPSCSSPALFALRPGP